MYGQDIYSFVGSFSKKVMAEFGGQPVGTAAYLVYPI